MMKIALYAATALATLALASPSANAFGVLKAVEDPVTGWVGAIPGSAPAIMVGSDGESPFDPFGAGFDTSDGIVLNADWAPDPAYAAAFGPGGWVQLPGTFTWVLPACIGGICENGPVKEPVAKWIFTPGGQWLPFTQSILLYDPAGHFSDLILVANDGPGGAATILFNSGVPEPASWALMILGFAGAGYALRRTRKAALTSA